MLSSASSRALRLGSVRLATTNVTTRISTPTCRRGLLTRAFLPVTVATSPSKQRHTTSYAASAQSLASERVRAARVPSDVDIEEAELDAEVLSPGQIQLRLSDRAAEKLQAITDREGAPTALRITVESGGCHGYQYKLDIAELSAVAPEDYILQHPNIRDASIVTDAVSLPLLNGSMVDFATELIGSSFRVIDNPNATGKGCGCGVSWELKI